MFVKQQDIIMAATREELLNSIEAKIKEYQDKPENRGFEDEIEVELQYDEIELIDFKDKQEFFVLVKTKG